MTRPRHTRLAFDRSRTLRRSLTPAEARLWARIRGKQLGVRFRRQVPVGYWIADFACLRPKLVIEIDDISHEYRDEADRTSYLEDRGFWILRFTNRRVALELDDVVRSIRIAVDESG